MNPYLEQSISAYKIVKSVTKSLNIDEAPSMSVLNGNVNKIITECIKIIESNYKDKRTKELIKYYIAHSFFEGYDLENQDFDDDLLN